jgi:hypothetical protein
MMKHKLLLPLLLAGLASALAERTPTSFISGIEQRVRAWQPTQDEHRFDQIGWAEDLVSAKALAAKHHRPVFVFTYNGSTKREAAIARQRC